MTVVIQGVYVVKRTDSDSGLCVPTALHPWQQPGPVHHGDLHRHVATYPFALITSSVLPFPLTLCVPLCVCVFVCV